MPGGGGTSAKRGKSGDGSDLLLNNNKFAVLVDEDGNPVVQARKEKIPPIFVANKDLARVRDEMKKCKANAEFKLCSEGIKVLCSDLEGYKLAGQHLRRSFPLYTHDLPGSRPFKVVIRGLPDFTVESVQAELERLKLKPLKVFKMTRKDQAEKNYRDYLFLVHFERGTTTLNQLKEIRAIHQVIVRWEPYRSTNRAVTQCQKCLRFGHGTRNCYMGSRCPNCGGLHIEFNPACDSETKCGNCGGSHPATDTKCPARARFIKIRKKASGPKKQRNGQLVINPEDFPPLPGLTPTPTPAPGLAPRPAPPTAPSGTNQNSGEGGTASSSQPLYTPEELVRIFLETVA